MSKIKKLISLEERRQQMTLNLIPSENYASFKVREVLASRLTNKYSEGYPGKRYYAGNKYYDEIELYVQNLARKVFRLSEKDWHVNVQSYSGSPANLAVYLSVLNPGDTIMGMELASGGHLTHGHKVNFSGRFFNVIRYGVSKETGLIDYNEVEKIALEHKPKMIIAGITSYSRDLDFKRFRKIADKIKAHLLADISHTAGLIAAGFQNSPFPYADFVMTTTHKTLRGPRGAIIFCKQDFADVLDKAVFPLLQGGPHNNNIAAMGVCLEEVSKPAFKKYAQQILKNSKTLASELVKYGFHLVSGGTDNHLTLIDLRDKNLDGQEAEQLLEQAGIITNRNAIYGDEKPYKPSGLRVGTPAATSRGMKEKEMKQIARWIKEVLINKKDPSKVKKEVEIFCKKFPLP